MSEYSPGASQDYEDVFKAEKGLEPYLYAPVPLQGGGHASAVELLLRFAYSPFGEHMAHEQDLRYSERYGFDRDLMHQYLGPDVNPLLHQHHNAIYTARILKAHVDQTGQLPIPEEKVGTIIFNDGRHDSGESIHDFVKQKMAVVGDIPAGNKTPQHRIDESVVRRFFREDREHAIWKDIDPEVWYSGELDIGHWDEQTDTHRVSQASHDIQTYDTSEMAGISYNRLKGTEVDPHVLRQLERLYSDVGKCVEESIGQAGIYLVYANDYAIQKGISLPSQDSKVA